MAKELLTDVTIRNAKPNQKDQRLNDGRGLYLLLKTNGAKWWRLDYSINGKRKTLSLGVYPNTTLSDARRKATDARNHVANGIDPSDTRKEKKQFQHLQYENQKRVVAGLPIVGSFGEVALEYFDKKMADKSERHRIKTWRAVEVNLMPNLKNRPINEIKAPELLEIIRRIEYRTVTMAHRLLQVCGQIFRYGIATGRCESDITQSLRGALANQEVKHYAAVTDPTELGDVLRGIENCNCTFTVKSALRIAPMLFVRPGELRAMEWLHIDLNAAQWRYFITKTKTQHIVPLPRQAIEILRNLHPLTGQGRYVFQSEKLNSKTGFISDRALLDALSRVNANTSMHGFRATARTILDEQLGFRVDFVEHQLAHSVRDPNGRAYNRTAHLEERRKMMQTWADYLDDLRNRADKCDESRQLKKHDRI